MTRIFTDGAEMRDVLFFNAVTGGTSVNTTVYASGSASYNFGYSAQTGTKTISALSELYFRERSYITAAVNASTQISFRNVLNTVAKVTLDTLGRWIIQIDGATVDTSTETHAEDTWYCVEVWLKLAAAPNGRFVLKIDGNTLCDFTGDTDPSAYGTIDNLYWVQAGGSTPVMRIDDIALNDTAGGVDDSWIGGGRIIKITPDGNGAASEWTGSDGNAVDNYLLVDEYPMDSDTTYVYEDASETGDLDQYTLSDYDGTDRTITRIYAECRGRKTSADAAALKIGFDTGASVNTDDVGILYETYSIRLVGAEYALNPDDAAAWEEADIDALEFVAEVG
jgi:hypothetical protein